MVALALCARGAASESISWLRDERWRRRRCVGHPTSAPLVLRPRGPRADRRHRARGGALAQRIHRCFVAGSLCPGRAVLKLAPSDSGHGVRRLRNRNRGYAFVAGQGTFDAPPISSHRPQGPTRRDRQRRQGVRSHLAATAQAREAPTGDRPRMPPLGGDVKRVCRHTSVALAIGGLEGQNGIKVVGWRRPPRRGISFAHASTLKSVRRSRHFFGSTV